MLPNTSIAPIAIYAWLFIQLLLFIFVVYVGFKVIQMANYTKKIHNQLTKNKHSEHNYYIDE